MKFLLILFTTAFMNLNLNAQKKSVVNQNQQKMEMKLNAGFVTAKIKETKEFYVNVLNFGVSFENEFYLLMHTPGEKAEISFLLPNHPSQQPLFHAPFANKGAYLTIEVDDVDAWHEKIKKLKIPIAIELRDEPWGDRHFAIVDPNGIGIDMVTYAPRE